jgi:hypothetical protein
MNTISTILGPQEIGSAPRRYSQQDLAQLEQAEQQLTAAGMDFTATESAIKNSNLIGDYFEKNRNVAVTVATVIHFVNVNNKDFVWRTPAQREFDNAAATVGKDKAEQITNWLAKQGRPGTLANTGDQFFENAALLLTEIGAGRAVTPETIYQAEGRLNSKPGKTLSYVPMPRRAHYGRHTADDLPGRKPGQMFAASEVNKTRSQYHQETQAYQNSLNPQARDASVIESEARRAAESLRGNTHGETEMIQRVVVCKPGTSETDWEKTLGARRNLQSIINKNRQVRSYAR